jgi:cytochrome c-type biogenesis protein CcmH/NrfG
VGGCRPDWSKAHFRCGEALMDLNRASEAVKHFQTAARLEPSVFVRKRLSEVRELLGWAARPHVLWDTGSLRRQTLYRSELMA